MGGPSPATRTVPAVEAHEAFGALAHVALICVDTGAPVLARGREAGVRHWLASCKKDSGHQSSSTHWGFNLCSQCQAQCKPEAYFLGAKFQLPLPREPLFGAE